MSASGTSSRKPPFTAVFILVLALSIAAAVAIAPLVADGLAAAGIWFPFPRIFDRVLMVALAATTLMYTRRLELAELLGDGFDTPRRQLADALLGIAVALATMLILFILADRTSAQPLRPADLALRAVGNLFAALLIAVIEEAFFRAVVLGGMVRDFGWPVALPLSAAIYALAHLIRSPKHYYLVGFHPIAGWANFVLSCERIAHPGNLIAMTFGLFLLGLLLGTAFLRTGRVYLSIGLHMGFVIGAKCWPVVADGAQFTPWLAGPGPVPLIAAPAAWVLSLVLIVLVVTLKSRRVDRDRNQSR